VTRDEALIIVRVVLEVDGGCSSCAAAAFVELQEKLPDQPWTDLIAEVDPESYVLSNLGVES
jgi:hypothetical protein